MDVIIFLHYLQFFDELPLMLDSVPVSHFRFSLHIPLIPYWYYCIYLSRNSNPLIVGECRLILYDMIQLYFQLLELRRKFI